MESAKEETLRVKIPEGSTGVPAEQVASVLFLTDPNNNNEQVIIAQAQRVESSSPEPDEHLRSPSRDGVPLFIDIPTHKLESACLPMDCSSLVTKKSCCHETTADAIASVETWDVASYEWTVQCSTQHAAEKKLPGDPQTTTTTTTTTTTGGPTTEVEPTPSVISRISVDPPEGCSIHSRLSMGNSSIPSRLSMDPPGSKGSALSRLSTMDPPVASDLQQQQEQNLVLSPPRKTSVNHQDVPKPSPRTLLEQLQAQQQDYISRLEKLVALSVHEDSSGNALVGRGSAASASAASNNNGKLDPPEDPPSAAKLIANGNSKFSQQQLYSSLQDDGTPPPPTTTTTGLEPAAQHYEHPRYAPNLSWIPEIPTSSEIREMGILSSSEKRELQISESSNTPEEDVVASASTTPMESRGERKSRDPQQLVLVAMDPEEEWNDQTKDDQNYPTAAVETAKQHSSVDAPSSSTESPHGVVQATVIPWSKQQQNQHQHQHHHHAAVNGFLPHVDGFAVLEEEEEEDGESDRPDPPSSMDEPTELGPATKTASKEDRIRLPQFTSNKNVAKDFVTRNATGTTSVVAEMAYTDYFGEECIYEGAVLSTAEPTPVPHGFGWLEYKRTGNYYGGDFVRGRCTGRGRLFGSNGDFYKGEFLEDLRHGVGTTKYADGRVFEGTHIKGEMSHGVMTYPDGSKYTGSLVHGLRHGKGRYDFARGGYYEGDFWKGKFSGQGKMVWNDGTYYKGAWLEDERHGKGTEYLANGVVRYECEWSKGKPVQTDRPAQSDTQKPGAPVRDLTKMPPMRSSNDGSRSPVGEISAHVMSSLGISAPESSTSSNSCQPPPQPPGPSSVSTEPVVSIDFTDPHGGTGTYTGSVTNSTRLPHGFGRMDYAQEGRWYKGNWVYGRWTGHGQSSNGVGDFYKGGFRDHLKHGHGSTNFADGRVYTGEYASGQMTQGEMTYPDGSKYSGSWFYGMFHGEGTCTFADGAKYEGQFQMGKFAGKGKMTWSNFVCYEGEWWDGVMHGRGKEVQVDGTVRYDGEWKKGKPTV